MIAAHISTPIGLMLATVNDQGALTHLDFVDQIQPERMALINVIPIEESAALQRVAEQLAEYFSGDRKKFDLPLAAEGTPFLCAVWDQLVKLPYGATIAYGELGRLVSDSTSARAIGHANSVNPIAIVVPCHRVIGADGKLVGYSGGMDRKVALLRLEGAIAQGDLF